MADKSNSLKGLPIARSILLSAALHKSQRNERRSWGVPDSRQASGPLKGGRLYLLELRSEQHTKKQSVTQKKDLEAISKIF